MNTPTPPVSPGAQALINLARERLEAQPWYKRFSNTVTGLIGAVGLAIWLAITAGLEIPSEVTKWVTMGIMAATVLGLYKTKNGTSPAQVQELEDLAGYVGEHRR